MSERLLGRTWQSERRAVSILLIICMIFSFGTLASASVVPVSIEIESASGAPGDTVTVAVYMAPGDTSFYDFSMTLNYDLDVFEEVQTGDVGFTSMVSANPNVSLDKIGTTGLIALQDASPIAFDKEKVFSIQFKIKNSAVAGSSTSISVASGTATYTVMGAPPETILDTNITSGTVTVTGTGMSDTAAPTVIQATYTNISARTPELQLTFSEQVTAAVHKKIVIRKVSDNSNIVTIKADDTTQVSIAGAMVSIKPAGVLSHGTDYYVLIDEGAFVDASNNAFAGFAGTTDWMFTTDAAVPQTVTVDIGRVTGTAGSTVSVPVTVAAASGSVGAYGIKISFDKTILEVSSITGQSGDHFASMFDNADGWLKAAWADASGGDHALAAGSAMFTVQFRIKVNAAPGETALNVSDENDIQSFTFSDTAIVEMTKMVSSGKVTIVLPSRSSSSSPSASAANAPAGVEVLVNGKVEQAGTAVTTTVSNQTVTTVAVDQMKLEGRLAAEGQGAVITILVNTGSDVVVGELNGQMVKNMEGKQAVVAVKTERATYTLPAQQINISAISQRLGRSVELQEIKVRIVIAEPTEEQLEYIERSAVGENFQLVAAPVQFKVEVTYGDRTVEVSEFKSYVEREIAIPKGVDLSRITTGVVNEPDGTVRHVPTKIVTVDGKYYAKINSLTNSAYSVVYHPREFKDVAGHWAQDAVNDMGSRMIVSGVEAERFYPDQAITRAEFAAIIVRGLGMKLESGEAPFSDVPPERWFHTAVHTAYSHGLINGFEDGQFAPADNITREQAMVIIAKAMSVTGLKTRLKAAEADDILNVYQDAGMVAEWARRSAADCLQAGIVNGRSNHELAPKATVTRAEVALMIQRLLQVSELI
ncbi:S-layer homology domain-containing protein [Cohnella sp. LGH]|uniref:S-layer homology domain-containing protein n=1 Tax=Cohnella sp. LGH TaxID=1619153 RepID=UPI001ADA21E2|nr:S-layer homology domain-containing protein [Cohnella sp. LGH]QTH40630.1 S-layer homology domain-containing protein [Cohnella sp. LGH]